MIALAPTRRFFVWCVVASPARSLASAAAAAAPTSVLVIGGTGLMGAPTAAALVARAARRGARAFDGVAAVIVDEVSDRAPPTGAGVRYRVALCRL